MAGLIPLNHKGSNSIRTGAGFNDFYNMLDDFFSDNWLQQGRSLARDTFKIDIEDTEKEYRIEAELPGISKDEINLSVEDDNLCISISRTENVNTQNKNYIHKERRATSMSRRVRLANASLDEIKAKLEEGILTVNIPKQDKSANTRKIEIE